MAKNSFVAEVIFKDSTMNGKGTDYVKNRESKVKY